MRLRTQLILATFLLAVVPLAAIVLYSHHSSKKALESAYRREAVRLTAQMDRRLASIRADLDQRLTAVSALPINSEAAKNGEAQQAAVGNIITAMGDVASLVDSVEFQPLAVLAGTKPRNAAPRAKTAEKPETPETPEAPEPPEDVEPAPQVAVVEPAPPVEPSFVIHIPDPPQFPRFRPPAEQRELVRKISSLAAKLSHDNISEEERHAAEAELDVAQKRLTEVINARQQEFDAQIADAQRQLDERNEALRRAGVTDEQIRAERDRQRQQRAHERELQAAGKSTEKLAEKAAEKSVEKTLENRVIVRVDDPAAHARVAEELRKKVSADVARTKARDKQITLILGNTVGAPVKKKGEVVGQVKAQINPEEVIRRILGATSDTSEIAFAIDREGNLYTRGDDDRHTLETLGVPQRIRAGRSVKDIQGWIVTATTDPQSGLRIGVARPVGENFDGLKRAAARNFALGLGLIAFALIGIVPFANHITRDVKTVADGAERIAHGDLMTRLPVKSRNEFGQLALAFNRMAEDLSVHQQKLLEQERTRKEQELQQRLLAVEYERKTGELEEARRFQLSLLPKELPRHSRFDIAVFTQTATEVGGDYYDFHVSGDEVLSVTIGDATGHGAKAGTMVMVIKTLFAGYRAATSPAEFLGDAAEKIKRMDLGRMSMALSLARLEKDRITLATAGMPPVLIHRTNGAVEELSHGAPPLGTIGTTYEQKHAPLASGDTVLFLTDGLPELLNDDGAQFGYGAALDAFAQAAKASDASGVIAHLESVMRQWHGDQPPNDDVTFVVVRVA
ncbi:MAG TPA: SpoIIE family protein phosphatase [Thermoanaerobaculia bacterium]|nr:SpoIIE family protein phosphatase [Thermoanaerobaculia bacterium]